MNLTLEDLLTSPAGFALTTASPAQRAACRIVEGRPLDDLAAHPDVLQFVGGAEAVQALPVGRPPTLVILLAAVRTAKSLLSVARALHASQTVDLTGVRPGEMPRVVIVSLTIDHAKATFAHLVGTIQARSALRRLLVGEPTADSVIVRHPSGKPVEIKVVAAQAGGASVVSRWLCGLILDEAPRFPDGAVRIQDLIAAARARLLPGAQILLIGSPWAPAGYVYDAWCNGFGKPTEDTVVLHGTGPLLNPLWFTPERCERLRNQDPIAYRADVLGEFVDGEITLFDPAILRRSMRAELERRPPPESRWVPYAPRAAAVDLATRRNAATLVVTWIERDELHPVSGKERLVVGIAKEWRGTTDDPMSISKFFFEVGKVLSPYGIHSVVADPWSFDASSELAKQQGLTLKLREHSAIQEMWPALLRYVSEEAIELPSDPQVLADLCGVRSKPTAEGGFRVYLPTTPDGRHSDYAAALALSALHVSRHAPRKIIIGQRQVLPF